MPKILFIGDVVGKGGRRILRQALPKWQEQYRPDATIVNVENLAHGKGVTLSTLAELAALDIDCFTGGNHIFNKDADQCFDRYAKLIRPANFAGSLPGHGYYRFAKGGRQYLVINLIGQVFMEHQFEGEIGSPFAAIGPLLAQE
ncbi:MAG TPA: YmdB family metallophosphoesterase, partial [Patescibacteria group bacterium]|nr:YmdB family metallophosphoesterase [Patescibacteria group bacterium]